MLHNILVSVDTSTLHAGVRQFPNYAQHAAQHTLPINKQKTIQISQ